jgi:hypothetical protein
LSRSGSNRSRAVIGERFSPKSASETSFGGLPFSACCC